MEQAISAAEVHRGFSRILRHVRDGHNVAVTSHGRPVARPIPVNQQMGVASATRTLCCRGSQSNPWLTPEGGRETSSMRTKRDDCAGQACARQCRGRYDIVKRDHMLGPIGALPPDAVSIPEN